MNHDHSAVEISPASARRARRILTWCVVPLLLATIAGLVVFWPSGDSPVRSEPNPVDGPGFTTATVVEVTGEAGTDVLAELDDGTERIVPVQVPPEIVAAGIDEGDRMRVFFTTGALDSGSPYVFVDFIRDVPMLLLTILYALVVLAVARIRGLMAIVGLLASMAVVTVFLVPALMSGSAPLLVTLIGASAMMFFAVYLAHGVSIRTTTALLGTFIGLAVTTFLAWWSTGAANLSGAGSDTALMLSAVLPGVGLREILLCGIVIAGLGALNDVTITQASAVWELYAANPRAPMRQIFGRAMRIGRDHIASTVYTLAFAYVGTAMTTLMVVMLYDRSITSTLTAGEIAEEVVRTLVSSIGLVLAIPATTAIGAVLVRSSRPAARACVAASTEAAEAAAAGDPTASTSRAAQHRATAASPTLAAVRAENVTAADDEPVAQTGRPAQAEQTPGRHRSRGAPEAAQPDEPDEQSDGRGQP